MQASLPVSLKYPRLREQITVALGEKDRLVKGPFVEALSDFVKAASLKDLVAGGAARTCELAGFVNAAEVDSDLLEWNYGQYEGLRRVEIDVERPYWQLFRDGCPNGESPAQIAVRAGAWYAFVPSAAPSSRTELLVSISLGAS